MLISTVDEVVEFNMGINAFVCFTAVIFISSPVLFSKHLYFPKIILKSESSILFLIYSL